MARVRNAIVSLMALSTLLMGSYGIRNSKNVIDLNKSPRSGIITIDSEVLYPDSNGVLKTYTLILPDYKAGVYSSQDSYYDNWPINGNRVLPWSFNPQTFHTMFEQPAYGVDDEKNRAYKVQSMKNRTRFIGRYGSFMLLQLRSGEYMAILPIAGDEAISWLYADSSRYLKVLVCNYGTERVLSQIPVLAWWVAENIHEACYKLFEMVSKDKIIGDNFKLRSQKEYPEIFRYLGWCTWEEYKKNINEKLLINEITKVKSCGLPIRYAIIDDGHLSSENGANGNKSRLNSFSPNAKFPNGFAPILKLRNEDGLRWMGLWQNLNGYWGGFSPKNDFGDINNSLRLIEKTGMYMPKDDPVSITKVYDAFLAKSASDGFDFLKVDWQTANLYFLKDSPNAVRGAQRTSSALEDIAKKYFGNAIINCMAQNNVVLLNTKNTNVTRLSIDYKLNNLFMAKEHLLQSYYNSVFMSPTVWGDHDMFHTSDSVCGEIMALSKAVSGGPVYLSDAPNNIIKKMVWPLCYLDGELLRPTAPAASLQKSVFTSPLTNGQLYYVSAPMNNNAAAIIAYNLNVDSLKIEGSITVDDYMETGELLQPYSGAWTVPAEGLYLYDYFAKKGVEYISDYKFFINGFNHKYFILTPIVDGVAIIGRSDKYLSPAAVYDIVYGSKGFSFNLAESGEYLIWMKQGEPKAEGVEFIDRGEGLWAGIMPTGLKNKTIKIHKI
jgi:hypothetical protein